MLTEDEPIWKNAMCREIGQLSQGYQDVTGHNIIFMYGHQVPKGKKVTYGIIVCRIRPHKNKLIE